MSKQRTQLANGKQDAVGDVLSETRAAAGQCMHAALLLFNSDEKCTVFCGVPGQMQIILSHNIDGNCTVLIR